MKAKKNSDENDSLNKDVEVRKNKIILKLQRSFFENLPYGYFEIGIDIK